MISADEQEDQRHTCRRRLPTFLAITGRGLIGMPGDNDVGGVETPGAASPAGRCARGPGRQSRPGDEKGDLRPVSSPSWTAQAADIGDEREPGRIHAPGMRRRSQ